MLTNQGKLIIKKYHARQVSSIGDTLVLGAGSAAPAASDYRMGFEIARVPVSVFGYDFANNQIVFKGTLPEGIAGTVSEAGLWVASQETNRIDVNTQSFIDFTSSNSNWSTSTWSTDNTFIGAESLLLAGTANGASTTTLSDLQLDFGNNIGTDQFVFAYYNPNTNVTSIKFRFLSDSSNYFEFTKTSPAGSKLNFEVFSKTSATVVGSPDWSDITSFQVIVNSGATAGSVYLQGARIEPVVDLNGTSGLVSRSTLTTPFQINPNNIQDFEYRLGLSV